MAGRMGEGGWVGGQGRDGSLSHRCGGGTGAAAGIVKEGFRGVWGGLLWWETG